LRGTQSCLERLTQNLLDNAIRYMAERGEITVTTDTADNDAMLTVENTGPPVPIHEIPSLFEPFPQDANHGTTRRLDRSTSGPRSGAGDCPSCG
jgi:signal transduction histidine kinase